MYSANLRTLLEKIGFVRNRGLKAAVFLCCLLPRHDATGSARNEASFLAVFSAMAINWMVFFSPRP